MRRAVICAVVGVATALALAAPAFASNGVEHLHFAAGPYLVKPGANLILTDTKDVPKPDANGFMTRMAPNLHYAKANGKCCGAIPRVDVIHLHHGVWLTDGAAGEGEGNGQAGLYPFMASGEEKTIYQLPKGYGYPVGSADHWILNYMIHNLRRRPAKVYITYDMDFIPDSSPEARGITPVHPIWMDVEDHNLYPVFNVYRHSGRNGRFTFPDMAKNAYKGGPRLNLFTVDHSGTLVATAGHLHPGGLYDDLDLIRAGATDTSKTPRGTQRNSVRLFRSSADYFDKRGPISWDMAMTATSKNWRPRVNAGDVMRISTTYETKRASWYESMGIVVVWEAWDDQTGLDPFTGARDARARVAAGVDPFRRTIDETGHITHGHLAENNHHGGTTWLTVDPNTLRSCKTRTVQIAGFTYMPGDLEAPPTAQRCAPTAREGQSVTFHNDDASPLSPGLPGLDPSAAYMQSIFHTITACQDPCGLDTGISYPLANGTGGFDSAQLGVGTPASGKLSWGTPKNLRPGVYTFYCRIHPFMRGVFRIVG